ncbi:MAG: sugar nucleotide-binding protein, partial [Pseudomonadales bacterium]
MKALILGCNGQLGKALCRELGSQHSVHSLSRTDLNLANYQAIERVLGALEWDVLINAAAY